MLGAQAARWSAERLITLAMAEQPPGHRKVRCGERAAGRRGTGRAINARRRMARKVSGFNSARRTHRSRSAGSRTSLMVQSDIRTVGMGLVRSGSVIC